MDRIDPSRMQRVHTQDFDVPSVGRYPIALLTAGADFILILLAAHAAHQLRFEAWQMPAPYLTVGILMAVLVALTQGVANLYIPWRGQHVGRRILRLYAAWLLAVGIITLLGFGLKVSDFYSRLWFSQTILIGVLGTTLLRVAAALALRKLHAHGLHLKNIVLIESAGTTHGIQQRIPQLARQGYRVHACIDVEDDPAWFDELGPRITALGAQEIWLCLPIADGALVKPIVHALRHQTAEIRYLPEIDDFPLLSYRTRNLAGMYAVDISCSPMEGANRVIKRLEDLVLGSLIGLLILPICVAIALAIRVSSRGPVIFRQDRMGMNRQSFQVYKFRTMETHTEANGQVTQAAPGDPRVTRLGAFLRRTSLDELPQFYNVLKGDMSIVGPRPHALAHNEYYKDLVEFYMKRHKVKPGITGWAQVNGYRGATDTLDKMQSRVEHDLWYIRNWSLMLDLKIIAWTIFKGFLNRQP